MVISGHDYLFTNNNCKHLHFITLLFMLRSEWLLTNSTKEISNGLYLRSNCKICRHAYCLKVMSKYIKFRQQKGW